MYFLFSITTLYFDLTPFTDRVFLSSTEKFVKNCFGKCFAFSSIFKQPFDILWGWARDSSNQSRIFHPEVFIFLTVESFCKVFKSMNDIFVLLCMRNQCVICWLSQCSFRSAIYLTKNQCKIKYVQQLENCLARP